MPRAGFERAIPATKRPQTYALDRSATGIGRIGCRPINKQHTVIVAGASPHLLHADAAHSAKLLETRWAWELHSASHAVKGKAAPVLKNVMKIYVGVEIKLHS
jgi:hypothetical protein